MNKKIAQNPLTFSSFACLLAGWTLLWLFIGLGMKMSSDIWLVRALAISSITFGPVAALLAIAGIIFDRGRKVAVVALSLSLISTLLVFSVGG
jgi:hypothetical protein